MKKMLSFDASTKTTGCAIYEDGELMRYFLIDVSYNKDTQSRIGEMMLRIFDLINIEKPNIVVVEESILNRNPEIHRKLTMILGAIYGECVRNKIEHYSLRPSEWRALIRADGEKVPRKHNEVKKWSLQKAMELFNVVDVDDNVSDAILIGSAYLKKEKKDD